MSLLLKLDIELENPILFDRFLPESDDESLRINYKDKDLSFRIFISDFRKQVDSAAPDDRDSRKLRKISNLEVVSLTFEIIVKNPNEGLMEHLQNGNSTDLTDKFAHEIFPK